MHMRKFLKLMAAYVQGDVSLVWYWINRHGVE